VNKLFKHIWRKELQGELYTWKSMSWLVIASLLFSSTSYLLLTDRELSLLDQTELMLLLGQIIIVVALLIIAIDASSIITAEFENETAETIFLTPLSIKDFIIGKFLASLTLWVLLFLVALPYIIVASSGSHLTTAFIGYIVLLGTLGIIGIVAFIFAISLLLRSTKNTLTTSILSLLILAAPALFPTTLKNNAVSQLFSKIDPIHNIISSLDNVLVDYQTSVSQNWEFILPVLMFCVLMLIFLAFATRRFDKQGVIRGD
jgi:ABC-type transport system involved in multi-copper enzyme maturation permease subunit